MRDIEKYTENYMERDFEIYQVEYRRRKVLEQIEKYNPKVILEVGCGCEPLFFYAKNREWVIVEPSDTFCKVARQHIKDDKVKIVQGFMEEQLDKLNSKSYDMVICSSLLHEVQEPQVMLKGIFSLCSGETIVHINVPNAKSFHRVLARNMNIASEYEKSEKNILLQQNIIFDIDKLSNLVKDCGFEILDAGSYFIKPFTHRQMLEMMETQIIDKKVLDGLYNLVEDLPMFGSEIYVNCKKCSL